MFDRFVEVNVELLDLLESFLISIRNYRMVLI